MASWGYLGQPFRAWGMTCPWVHPAVSSSRWGYLLFRKNSGLHGGGPRRQQDPNHTPLSQRRGLGGPGGEGLLDCPWKAILLLPSALSTQP